MFFFSFFDIRFNVDMNIEYLLKETCFFTSLWIGMRLWSDKEVHDTIGISLSTYTTVSKHFVMIDL